MVIRIFLCYFLMTPVNFYSQGSQVNSFFFEPLINPQFGTKASYETLKQESQMVELMPLTKIGNIDYSSINLGLGVGYRLQKNALSLVYKTIYTTNGYVFLYYPNNNVLQAQYYRLKQDSRRNYFGINYTLELEKFKTHTHYVSINYGISFNRSSYLPPAKASFKDFTSIDSTDFELKKRIGHHIGLSYSISLASKKGIKILDFSFGYSFGLKNLDVMYIYQDDKLGKQNLFISKSRGSFFYAGISRKIHLKLH